MVANNPESPIGTDSESSNLGSDSGSISFSIGNGGNDSRIRDTYTASGDPGSDAGSGEPRLKRGRRSRAEIESAIREGTYIPPISAKSKDSIARDLSGSAVACLDVICRLLSRVRGQHWLLADEEKSALQEAGNRAFRHMSMPTGEMSKTADYILASTTVGVIFGGRIMMDVAIYRAQKAATYAQSITNKQRGTPAGPNYQTPSNGHNDSTERESMSLWENEIGENHHSNADFEFGNAL